MESGKLSMLCREGQPGWATAHASSVQDCLQSIQNFLWTHYSIASTLTCISLALTVATSSFLAPSVLPCPAPSQIEGSPWVTATRPTLQSWHYQAQSVGRNQPLTQGRGWVSISCPPFLSPRNFPGSGKTLPPGLMVAVDSKASLLPAPGICYDALRLPLVCHSHLLWLGSERQLHPDPTVGPLLF